MSGHSAKDANPVNAILPTAQAGNALSAWRSAGGELVLPDSC